MGSPPSTLRSARRPPCAGLGAFLVGLVAIGTGCGARSGLSLGDEPGLDAGLRRDAPGLDAPPAGRDASSTDGGPVETDGPGLDAPALDAGPLGRDAPSLDAPAVGVDAPSVDAPGVDAPSVDAPRVDAPSGSVVGCADGAREGFRDPTRFARIAACGGGFALPGVLVEEAPACGRAGGDDGPRPNGEGCHAADLCAAGWHVCRSAAEVAAANPDGCRGLGDPGSAFFATSQSGPGCSLCAVGTRACGFGECATDCAPDRRDGSLMANDLFGCGTLGDAPSAGCGPLDRFSGNTCASLDGPWDCGTSSGFDEALVVTKPGPDRGGVLCCRDDVTEAP